MNEVIKQAFDGIHAEESLKESVRTYLGTQLQDKKEKSNAFRHRLLMVSTACIVFLMTLVGGYYVYFLPVAAISVDVNPSLELEVNRFDQVVSASGFNSDAEEWLDSVDVKFLNYEDAIERLLNDQLAVEYLAQGENMSITVVGQNQEKQQQMLSQLNSCIQGVQGDITCYASNREHVDEAHSMGMSFGKYNAFLELKELDPDITAEDAAQMTMKQIRDRIKELSGDSNPQNGNGNGNGYGYGNQQQEESSAFSQSNGSGNGNGKKNRWGSAD